MSDLAKRFFYLCLLSRGPQDIPYSRYLFLLSLLAYVLTGIAGLAQSMAMDVAISASLVDVAILLIFVRLALQLFRKLARYLQMTTALLGVGAVFQLLTLPLLSAMQGAHADNAELSWILLLLFSWSLAVYAHIFREAFDIRTGPAFLITLAYILISFAANQLIFPQAGA